MDLRDTITVTVSLVGMGPGDEGCLTRDAEKAIRVPADRHATYGVGDEVDVVLEASMGMKAVWLAYFFPLLVLLAVALGLIALGVPEVWAGLSGIAAVGLAIMALTTQ